MDLEKVFAISGPFFLHCFTILLANIVFYIIGSLSICTLIPLLFNDLSKAKLLSVSVVSND